MKILDKRYLPADHEGPIYALWEKSGAFTPKIDKKKKPFSIILPLPNANDPMHMGHALFTVEDIMVRYHRMLGEPTLWLPGGDHAGIETQFVFEKHLSKKGQSRFDFDRQTLYRMIADFVEENKNINKDQMKLLGFSLDWTRYHYSLEPAIVTKVLKTFEKLHQDSLLYRGERMVNFCTRCGTAFSELEVEHEERQDSLYFLDYGPLSIATTRPETIFADVAIALHPKDKRLKDLKGKQAIIPLINKEIPFITDEAIDPDFGTAALKVTPAHDKTDWEIAERHGLKKITIIDRHGRLINVPSAYKGLTVKQAREKILIDLKSAGKLIKIKPLTHQVAVCYRCNRTIEPLLMPQWYVKVAPLAKLALEAVQKGKTKIVPEKRFKKMYLDWMKNIYDWNISRQIVWGPRLPVWYDTRLPENQEIELVFIDQKGERHTGNLSTFQKDYSLLEIEKGIQQLIAPLAARYQISQTSPGKEYLQETDTFDTWFLSGQWPLTTLGYPDSKDFRYFYPTSVMDTLWDILFFWVARMMMFGLYLTGDVPFKTVHLHSRVVDKQGQKMSKSKGNVINPVTMIEKYGADALRLALVYGTAPASDIALSEDKVRAHRNFTNKLWNASRFILILIDRFKKENPDTLFDMNKIDLTQKEDQKIIKKTNQLIQKTTKNIETYRFGQAAEDLYQFFWKEFCDSYIESAKDRGVTAIPTLLYVLITCLKLLHPFIPFVTETIYQELKKELDPSGKTEFFRSPLLITSSWPTAPAPSKTK